MNKPCKWSIQTTDYPQMVGGGKVLYVAEQHAIIQIWTEEEDPSELGENPPATREVLIVGTGTPIPESHPHHLGTLLSMNGVFVWHIYGNVGPEGLYARP